MATDTNEVIRTWQTKMKDVIASALAELIVASADAQKQQDERAA